MLTFVLHGVDQDHARLAHIPCLKAAFTHGMCARHTSTVEDPGGVQHACTPSKFNLSFQMVSTLVLECFKIRLR